MKKLVLIMLILIVILAGCNVPSGPTAEEKQATEEAEMSARLAAILSQTPPTPTATETEIPTETSIPSDTPTPTFAPTATWTMHEKGSAEVLVLYYADVADGKKDDPYYQWEAPEKWVRPIELEQQVRILYELGYTSITISDLAKVLWEGGELPEKPVMFTFDCNKTNMYKVVFPMLSQYGFVGNSFIVYKSIDAKNELSTEQLKEMIAAGWEVGSAGYDRQANTAIGTQIGQSKSAIEQQLGVEVLAYAYPDGYAAGDSISRVQNQLYKLAFGGNMQSTKLDFNSNLYLLPRYQIRREMPLNSFLNILPWKDGNISQETMEWAEPTPTLDPTAVESTRAAAESIYYTEEAEYYATEHAGGD